MKKKRIKNGSNICQEPAANNEAWRKFADGFIEWARRQQSTKPAATRKGK